MTEDRLVGSLKRGLELLAALNQPDVSEIRHLHQVTGLPKPTIVRLLDTLIALGYVARRRAGGYQLAAKVLSLSRGYNSAEFLLQVARPVLDWLRREYVWPSDMACFDHDAMVVIDTGTGAGMLSLNRTVGSRLPMMNTAFGRAWLAFCLPDERERILERLAQSTDPHNALARDRAAARRLLDAVRARGYSTSDQEYLKTTRGVAVPILVEGAPIACINMLAVAKAMTMRQAERTFAPPLLAAAASIARAYAEVQRSA